MMRTARSTAALCAKVDGGQIIPIEAIRGWLESAATRGDLAAQARLLLLNGEKPDAAAYTRLMDDVARSKDPAAVFRLGELVEYPRTQQRHGPVRGPLFRSDFGPCVEHRRLPHGV